MATLAVKYRPQEFKDVCGQENIISILNNQLKEKSFLNAYLFCGPSGCGKTTNARIFAKKLNNGSGSIIEVDAASNNGVDDVRQIIKDAQFMPLDGSYKIYILDECFHKNTLINTKTGNKEICKIKVGDEVATSLGYNRVSKIFKNEVPVSHLCKVNLSNNTHILTTKDHLFFTDDGWVCAKDLMLGDRLYDYQSMHQLWKNISYTQKSSKILLFSMLSRLQKQKLYSKSLCSYLSKLWEFFRNNIENEIKLLKTMSDRVCSKEAFAMESLGSWKSGGSSFFSQNEGEQSIKRLKKYTKRIKNKGKEWNTTHLERSTGRKWNLYRTSISIIRNVRSWLDTRVWNNNEGSTFRISSLLQSGSWFTKNQISDRGRWQSTQTEEWYIKRFKKDKFINSVRVESIEIYERGNNERSFENYFNCNELHGEYVTLYDLDVEQAHNYFAENILVHNCHLFSTGAWNAMLKLIEEPPAKTIFMFCTTDPQKIPATILGRVQRYNFTKISDTQIIQRLKYILKQENISTYEESALQLIAKISKGGMRDSIATMEKCLGYNTNLTIDNVTKALGIVGYDTMLKMLLAIQQKDSKVVLSKIEELYQRGIDLKLFIFDLIQFLLDLAKFTLTNDYELSNLPKGYENDIKSLKYNKDQLADIIDGFIKLYNSVKYESNPIVFIQAFLLRISL